VYLTDIELLYAFSSQRQLLYGSFFFSQNLTKECFVTPFFHITHVIHVTLGTARAPSQKRMKEKENTVIF